VKQNFSSREIADRHLRYTPDSKKRFHVSNRKSVFLQKFSFMRLLLVFTFLLFVLSCTEKSNESSTSKNAEIPENAQFSLVGNWANHSLISDKISFTARGNVDKVEINFEDNFTIKKKKSYTVKADKLQIIALNEYYDYETGNAVLDLFERDTSNFTIKWINPRQFELKNMSPQDSTVRIFDLVE